MSTKLFVELSDEQQEVVSGGSISSGSLYTSSSSVLNQVGFLGGSTATPMMATSGVGLVASNAYSNTSTYYGGFQIYP
jgi:hypothetical protein